MDHETVDMMILSLNDKNNSLNDSEREIAKILHVGRDHAHAILLTFNARKKISHQIVCPQKHTTAIHPPSIPHPPHKSHPPHTPQKTKNHLNFR
jgi:hypothetical protein